MALENEFINRHLMDTVEPLICIENAFYIADLLIFIAFIVLINRLPKGIWKTGKTRQSEKIDELSNKLRAKELKSVKSLKVFSSQSNNSKNNIFESYQQEKTFRAIDYAIGRHDWYESQRANIFRITIALCGILVSIVTIFARLESEDITTISSGLISLSLITLISLGRSVLLYNAELDGDRPYRLISDIRYWYFRYNLPKHSSESEEMRSPLNRAEAVAIERRDFFERVTSHNKLEKSVREDLEQIFILQVLQRYKHESLTKMRWQLSYLVWASALAVFSLLGQSIYN